MGGALGRAVSTLANFEATTWDCGSSIGGGGTRGSTSGSAAGGAIRSVFFFATEGDRRGERALGAALGAAFFLADTLLVRRADVFFAGAETAFALGMA